VYRKVTDTPAPIRKIDETVAKAVERTFRNARHLREISRDSAGREPIARRFGLMNVECGRSYVAAPLP
jgi:hypothetical protein